MSYIWCFRRVNRPNYGIIAGEYCIDKIQLNRTEFFYKAGDSILKGYFYPNDKSDKLMIVVHGYRSGADDFLPLIKEFLLNGFNVFSYDSTGTYDSKGRFLIGACQFLIDLDNTLNYIESHARYNKFKLYLVGHSLGGYAVLSILAIHKNVSGCLAFAPVNSGALLMIKTAQIYIGIIAKLNKPFFDIIQKISFGKYLKYTGIKGINSVDIPIIVAQGDSDKIVGRNNISVNSFKKDIINKNVTFIKIAGPNGGHSEIWHSKSAVEYKNLVDSALIKATKRQKIEYYKSVNHSLYSQANKDLIKKFIKAIEN